VAKLIIKTITILVFLPFLLTVINISFAAIKPNNKVTTVNSIQADISKTSDHLQKIKSSLEQLEKNLNNNNKNYIANIDAAKKTQSEIVQLEIISSTQLTELEDKRTHAKNKLAAIILTSLEPESLEKALATKLIKNSLSDEIKLIESLSVTAKETSAQIEKMNLIVTSYQQNNQDLLDTINQLEEKKQQTLNKYMTVATERDQHEVKLQNIEVTNSQPKQTNVATSGSYISPIKGHVAYSKHNKGLKFKYRGTRPVIAPQDGSISYAGSLASYGNVVIIDHGKDTRSIILGNFTPKREKDEVIKQGEIVGYTNDNKTNYDTLYYEIRKNSEAQNTMVLMDGASLKNTNL